MDIHRTLDRLVTKEDTLMNLKEGDVLGTSIINLLGLLDNGELLDVLESVLANRPDTVDVQGRAGVDVYIVDTPLSGKIGLEFFEPEVDDYDYEGK